MTTTISLNTSAALAPRLAAYLAQAPSEAPFGSLVLAGRPYQSFSIAEAELSFENITQEYVAAYVPTPASAGEIAGAGVGNFLNPAWQEEVEAATQRNGGLGDSENGFLAWSSLGFIRLRNPLLTPEQNRKLAEISLAMGIEVSKLPARSEQSSVENENINSWVNDFVDEYQQELSQFLKDPSDRIRIKDGRRYYILELKSTPDGVQVPLSYYYKLSGGFASSLRSAFGDVAKMASFFDPISLAAQGLSRSGLSLGGLAPELTGLLQSGSVFSSGLLSEIRAVANRLSVSDFSLSDIASVAAAQGARALRVLPGYQSLAPLLNSFANLLARPLSPQEVERGS